MVVEGRGGASPYANYCEVKIRQMEGHLTDPKLPARMREQMRGFETDFCKGRKLAIPTSEGYVRNLYYLALALAAKGRSDFTQTKRADLEEYLKSFEAKSRSVGIWARTSIKVFYRWLKYSTEKNPDVRRLGTIRKTPFPELVAWVEIGAPEQCKIEKRDLLTADELKRMLGATTNIRDRAFISLLIDSGARLGEILNLKIEDVHFETDDVFVRIKVSKSKKVRDVYLIDSAHDLRNWLEGHPAKSKPNFGSAFLFVPIKSEKMRLNYPFLVERRGSEIIERAAARAGVEKRVWAHGFRHISATRSRVIGMSDQAMKTKFGWSTRSHMAERYGHMDAKDVHYLELKARGLAVENHEEKSEVRRCLRCNTVNGNLVDRCASCGAPTDPKKYAGEIVGRVENEERIKRLEASNEKISKMLFDVLKNPDGYKEHPLKVLGRAYNRKLGKKTRGVQ